MGLIKIPIVVNKKNGQITSYLKKSDIPKKIFKEIRVGNIKELVVYLKK